MKEEDPLPNPLPDVPGEGIRNPRLILCALLLFGFLGHVLYVALDPPITLAGDEAHYWDWSRQLDWSYYSKGPAVAVLIRLGTLLLGDTELGVRMPAMVLAVGTSLCTWWLAKLVFKSERLATGAVALTYLVPMYVAGSMLMTIDSPFYFCWGMATCFGFLAIVQNKKWAWPLVGVFVGLGFLAKYASLLWLVGMIVFVAIHRRPYLKTIWPWLAIVIAFAFTTPVLIWNHQHDWVSFGHVARSTSENQSHFNPLEVLKNFGELIGGQIGLMNPIIFGIMAVAVWRGLKRGAGEGVAYLLAIGLPFFFFVSLITLRKNTEPNWPAPTYFTLIPLTAAFIAANWQKLRGWLSGALVIGLLAMLFLHESGWFYKVIPLPPRKWDPSARLVGWDDVGKTVSEQLKTLPPGSMVIADKYQLAAHLAFYVEGHPKTFCMGSYIQDPKERDRLTQYDLWPDRDLSQPSLRNRDAVFVGHEQQDLLNAFERVEELPELPIIRRGVTVRKQSLYRCYGFKGMTRPNDGLTKR